MKDPVKNGILFCQLFTVRPQGLSENQDLLLIHVNKSSRQADRQKEPEAESGKKPFSGGWMGSV